MLEKISFNLKEAKDVYSCDIQFKRWQVRFTMVFFKPLRYCRSFTLKSIKFLPFSSLSLQHNSSFYGNYNLQNQFFDYRKVKSYSSGTILNRIYLSINCKGHSLGIKSKVCLIRKEMNYKQINYQMNY